VTLEETVSRLRQRLTPVQEDVVAVYLFGSLARGTGGTTSDADIAVLYRSAPPARLDGLGLDLAADLEGALGCPVDLVVLNRAPADLVHRILRDGVLVVEADRSRRVAFEVRARNLYFDLEPHRVRYRRLSSRR
jgi:predicted nucleotidyltransferase